MNSNFQKTSLKKKKKKVHNNVLSPNNLKIDENKIMLRGANAIFLKKGKTVICHRKI